jgi:hypothetical protein
VLSTAISVPGNLAMAPMGMNGNADAAPPFPAATVGALPAVGPTDLARAAQVLFVVLMWMVVLVIPALVYESGWSAGAGVLADAYDGDFAAVAVAVTVAILGKDKHK